MYCITFENFAWFIIIWTLAEQFDKFYYGFTCSSAKSEATFRHVLLLINLLFLASCLSIRSIINTYTSCCCMQQCLFFAHLSCPPEFNSLWKTWVFWRKVCYREQQSKRNSWHTVTFIHHVIVRKVWLHTPCVLYSCFSVKYCTYKYST